MTERCQTKFTEKFDNQNYIIYAGVITASLTVLYFYRFHFVTIAFSYVLGCVACYYSLNSSILHNYLDQLKCHFVKHQPEESQEETPVKGCVTCGSKECSRHDRGVVTEPWVGLQIHKQLDQAIEDFYNTILEQFINSWYSKITLQPFFVDELRYQLRYASSYLLRRAIKIDYSKLITDRLVPCALRHYTLWAENGSGEGAIHPAAANRDAEMQYLRCIANAVMPYLLNGDDVKNSVFRALIREIFAGWVLLSITDVLADPYILNSIIILATGNETMAELPTTPNYNVEFLETFVRHTESVYVARGKLLRVELDALIADQDGFYAFMQFMKTTSRIHLLQFYKDIKSFQSKLLNPDLKPEEQTALHRAACNIYQLYLSEQSECRVPLQPGIADELYQLLYHSKDSIKKLQTSRALYQAARQSHAILEKIMLPRFLHSEEFYNLLLGPRLPTGYQKQYKMVKRPQVPHRTQPIDGHILDCFTNPDAPEGDGGEKMDILKYLDALTADETTREHDLSTYKVVLTNVEERMQFPPRRGCVRVFTLAVHCAAGDARLWTVDRSEHDFHLLRSKLHEFHGDKLLLDLPLPSRRDNSPMETLRYKYEDFLQRLLQKSLLQTSELLHLFLTVDGDFSMVVQASTLNANSTDLANLYQSVAHKLRKEKGQHLESFLRNLLFSSDMERYQALSKHGNARDVEEGVEMSEDVELEAVTSRPRNVRDIHRSVFGNNFDTQPAGYDTRDTEYQTVVVGFTQCAMYLLWKVVKARAVVTACAGAVARRGAAGADAACAAWLRARLRAALSHRALAHLLRLGHNLIFSKKASNPRADAAEHRELARKQLMNSIPAGTALLMGAGVHTAVHNAFELIQKPHLNKQLVYNLLDLCIMELFPELGATDKQPSKKPKS